MNHGPVLFFGILISLAASFMTLVFGSYHQLNRQAPAIDQATGRMYPVPRPGDAMQGEAVYKANGCAACHTQQVRQNDGDLKRGWGKRLSVSRDFAYAATVLPGHNRIGPDLAGVGSRTPEKFAYPWQHAVRLGDTNQLTPEQIAAELDRVERGKTAEIMQWHLLHLYNPRITSAGSTMPGYPFLFKKRPVGLAPSPLALDVPEKFIEPGMEVVPTDDALALISYLLNLKADQELLEAPIIRPRLDRMANTNQAPAEAAPTNAPAPAAPKAP